MKVINFNISNIYIKLRTFGKNNWKEKLGIICADENIEDNFLHRFEVNHCSENNLFFFWFSELNEQTVLNLKTSIDIWNGGIVFANPKDIDIVILGSLITFCLEAGKDVFILKEYWPFKEIPTDEKVHLLESLDEI